MSGHRLSRVGRISIAIEDFGRDRGGHNKGGQVRTTSAQRAQQCARQRTRQTPNARGSGNNRRPVCAVACTIGAQRARQGLGARNNA